jgi:hypothetical protein
MTFSIDTIYLSTKILVSFSVVVQSLELFFLKPKIESTWKWSIVREDYSFFPGWIRTCIDFLVGSPVFWALMVIRLLLAGLMLTGTFDYLSFALLLLTFLSGLRWRGIFNGGSDYMTALVLLALSVSDLFNSEIVSIGCLLFVGVQSITSYFMAGWAKARSPGWRSGRALLGYFSLSIYTPVTISRQVALMLSWLVIVSELVFPLVVVNQKIAVGFLGLAFFFHMGNAFLFGLNRFTLAWVASYPAIYFTVLVNLN